MHLTSYPAKACPPHHVVLQADIRPYASAWGPRETVPDTFAPPLKSFPRIVSAGAEVHDHGSQFPQLGRATSSWKRHGSPAHAQPMAVKPGRA
jgi:hypothetical protein